MNQNTSKKMKQEEKKERRCQKQPDIIKKMKK
jgi:hypothetical protein